MNESRKSAAPLVITGLVIIGIPVVYLLLVGPVVWLEVNGFIQEGTSETIYFPVVAGIERFSWFRALITWYIELFI